MDEIEQLKFASEKEICLMAKARGYRVFDAPAHYKVPGVRIGDSKATEGPDNWMNAANVRLYEIQLMRKEIV